MKFDNFELLKLETAKLGIQANEHIGISHPPTKSKKRIV